MKNDTLLELQDIVHTISSHTRVSSSKGIEEARRVIRKFLKKMGLPFIEEGFSVEKNL
ncbi:MAG TPA: Zn-dependent exopeptidase M28, partial [Aquificaceae bacterium]|nr:Zn-dependent exopeptidase M28 [Aquificaceae bacterium]